MMKEGDMVKLKPVTIQPDYDCPEIENAINHLPELDIYFEHHTKKTKIRKARWHPFPYHWQRGIVLEVKRDRVKVYWDEHMGATWLMKNTLEVVSESG